MSRVITVANTQQLRQAVSRSIAGDTILLAPGNYGITAITGRPAGLVTIRPLDPEGGVEFTQLRINHSQNLLLEGFTINRAGISSGHAMQINNSSGITVADFRLHGSLDGNVHNDGSGMSISDSRGIMVLNSSFQQLSSGITIARTADIVVAGNHITETREGVHMSGVTNGLFERNFLGHFDPAPEDHADFFQVQSARNGASHNLTFRNNVMIQPDHMKGVQGIFIRSETVADGNRHSDITIENNFYEGTIRNAIAVADADRVIIRQNTVLEGERIGNAPAIIVGNLNTAVVERNIAPLFLHRSDSTSQHLIMRDNIDVIDSRFGGEVHVDALFDRSFTDSSLASMTVRAGSLADQRGAGARLSGEIVGFSAPTSELLAHYAAITFDPVMPPVAMV